MLLYWIWFAQLKKLTCEQKKFLLEHFRDPEELYHSDEIAFSRVDGITKGMMEALEDKSLDEAEDILQSCREKGIGMITLTDTAYPAGLKNIFDPPMVLYYRGQLPLWEQQPVISIVGTRKATPAGMRAAQKYGAQIAACGGLVVSGGAAGGDTMALEGALSAGKSVVCVFGCGVDVYYPAGNRKLFQQIAVNGCLLSEYPPKTEANAWHFPQRNRILSGLSNGVLVVEAPAKSGALITARLAAEQGRDVYVIPGSVEEKACAGSNALLQEYGVAALSGWDVVKGYQMAYPKAVEKREAPVPSAKPVAEPAGISLSQSKPDQKSIDKEEKSSYSVGNRPAPVLTEQEQAVYAYVQQQSVLIDSVIDAMDLPAGTVKAILTKLTVKGLLRQEPGGRVSRKS